MSRLLLILAVLVTVSCPGYRPQPIPLDPGDTDQCAVACLRMSTLGCPEGAPLPDGTTCAKFCVNTQTAGHSMNPTCLSKIKACSEIPACSVNREGRR